MRRTTILLAILFLAASSATAQTVTTIAGGGPNNVPAASANLNSPRSTAVDAAGNLYIVAQGAHRVYKVDPAGQLTQFAGVGFSGFGGDGGPATKASFSNPWDIAFDSAGNAFIADGSNNRIRRVDAVTGIITTVAGSFSGCSPGTDPCGDGGRATVARLNFPTRVAFDSAGNLFIADQNTARIRRVAAGADGLVTGATDEIMTTVAGNGVVCNPTTAVCGDGGPAPGANLRSPQGIAFDGAGNLFIADFSQRIRRVAAGLDGLVTGAADEIITTVAGSGISDFAGDGGPASSAQFRNPVGLAFDSTGNLYVADLSNLRVRRVAAGADGLVTGAGDEIITTVAGNGINCSPSFGACGDGGPATSANGVGPGGVGFDSAGNLLISDLFAQRVRRVDAAGPNAGKIFRIAGNGFAGFSGDGGPATSASLFNPSGAVMDMAGNLFIADVSNARVRRVDALTGIITTVAGTGLGCPSSTPCGDGGPAANSTLTPQDLAFDAAGNLYIADSAGNRIRRVVAGADGLITGAADEIITTVAGSGVFCGSRTSACGDGAAATSASFNTPVGIGFDGAGNLYVADQNISRVRRVAAGADGFVTGAADEIITTVAGSGLFCSPSTSACGDGGPAASATLAVPVDVALDAAGNLYFSDSNIMRVRRVDAATGIITTVAGAGFNSCATNGALATSSNLASPFRLTFDSAGNLHIAERGCNRIVRIDAVGGSIAPASTITIVAGNGSFNFAGDGELPTNASFAFPTGVAFDGAGQLYIADLANQRIRMVDNTVRPAPIVTSLSPSSRAVGEVAFTLNVFGRNFEADSVVRFNGTDRATTFVSQSTLRITVDASDLVAQGTFPVQVFTPGPGGGLSNTVNFTVSKRSTFVGNFFCSAPGGLPAPGVGMNCFARVFDNSGGTKQVPTGTVNFTSNQAGTFSSSSCTIVPSGPSTAECSVTFTPAIGSEGLTYTVVGTYSGDATFFGSATSTPSFTVKRTVSVSINCPSPVTANAPATCTLHVTDTSPGTPSVPTGSSTWNTNLSSGSFVSTFNPTTCALTADEGSTTTSSCSTIFTPTPFYSGFVGAAISSYSGDALHHFTSGSTGNVISVDYRNTSTSVACLPSPVGFGLPATCTATVMDISPGTAVTPPGNVSFSSNKAGSFSATFCALTGSGDTASCSVTYTPGANTVGTHTITAGYASFQQNPNFSNRPTHRGNNNPFALNVINPDSTPPVITPNVTGTLGNNGWYTSDVNVTWTVNDPDSAISSQTGCDASSVTADTAGVTFTCEATSLGGTVSESVTIKRDATKPTASASALPAPNANGWNNTDVTVSFSGTDNLSGIASCSAAVVLSSDGANQSASGTCTDNAGNVSDAAAAGGINIDKTAPTIATSRTPAANANGWNNTAVDVRFEANDTLSGVEVPIEIVSLTLQGANQSASHTFTDRAGNSASATVGGINIDLTPPVIAFTGQSPLANGNGWNNTNVTLNWSCSDVLSGPAAPGTSQTLMAEGMNQSATGTCNDLAGNSASHTQGGVNIDKTAPAIALTTPPNGAVYLLNAAVAANYSCSDLLSMMATCAGTVANGANISTSPVGAKSFTVNATDMAGNPASVTQNYSVQYNFVGFLQPVDNLPVINQAKPGRTIPVKWQLTDAGGAYVSDLGSLMSLLAAPIACDASPTAIVEEQLSSPGSTVFRYDATTNQFIYNWQSASGWRGCRLLQVTLSDGTQHWAKFNFK